MLFTSSTSMPTASTWSLSFPKILDWAFWGLIKNIQQKSDEQPSF
ncbi:hypothetical protein AM1_0219 [Acaryochloris marina MBIC11017]|uniref:Uncharacterized protein n=1 Tax=Acaryochloris marina (strain MBIC 11017) TaxID=329726 RepID=B0C7P5_ACAM1|nr:hypothetical protein AM1_0219 [Acaryochloris marina MBIC11017]